ncbi:Sec-independent protein translocase protein TatB [Chelativorans sp. M5D2P16]|uniref:Sec-independent protein translocase protein TatB n=1 Tax=Chelativorans sp. M5D2P16 TaxID=3095678 RepID=UPI002ACA127A|nr:Sec-independent protein translocase protein TatB [Chelativorans sp. M5D2P16]MDZ5696702.1 Sec-independent protein translocase protein TatB [Chelativorans sp. M5D2P16]
MFGIGGTELFVIVLVVLIVFGPKELPKAMRSAGAMMRTFNRVSGEYRRQFEQALREAERELEIEETRKSVEAAFEDSPSSTQAAIRPNDQNGGSTHAPGKINPVSSEHGNTRLKKGRGNA